MHPTLDLVPRSFFSRLATRMLSGTREEKAQALPSPSRERGHARKPFNALDAGEGTSSFQMQQKSRPPFLSYADIGQPIWAPRDYAAFAREGFMQNAVVYRCVRLIAENTAAVPLLLYSGDTEIEHHPLKTLLRAPHPTATYPDFMESFLGFLLVSGNAYIEAVSFGGEIRELHLLRPDRVKVVPGADGWPEAYDYTVDGRTTRIEGEAAPGIRRVLHMRLFHPVNDHYGLSPIEAAACAIDLHNAAAKWNKALLDNSARPSGALVYTSRDGNLTPDQFDRLKSELEHNFQGSGNAGRPLLLEGGLDWKAMSMTPKDLDFVEAKNAAAREIALALGVPPLLLGIPGDNTYSNYAEANSALWRQTIIPLVERIALQLGNWLSPGFGNEALRLIADTDQSPALAAEKDALWKRLEGASFLSTDEKRIAAGYGANTNQLSAKVFNPNQPRDDLGRWTDGGGSVSRNPERTPSGDPLSTPTISTDDPNLIRVQSGDDPPLKRLHPDKTYELDRIAKSSLEHWCKQSTADIVDSLKPGSKQPLTTYPDGTVANGNTRLKVLEERGYDVSKLPRNLLPRSGAPFSNPNLRPGGGPFGKKPPRS